MPKMSKHQKEEWSFFLNEKGRRTYNVLCRRCVRDCKQSFRVAVIQCPKYRSKRAVGEVIAETADDSARQIQRYIRLTNLIPVLLDRMDEGKIAFSVGVELSYLPDEAQYDLLNAMERNDCTPSYAQAVRFHKAYNVGALDRWLIEKALAEPKPNQQEHIRLKREAYARFFPEHYTAAQIEQDIQKGLELLRRQRERSRDAR